MKFKIHLTIILAALTLTSCQLLQKEKLTSKHKSQKEALQFVGQRNVLNTQSQLVLIDSSHNDFTMMLWPKGKFTFSVANGFEGEAERILIKGKQVNEKQLTLKQETMQDSAWLKANYTNEKTSNTTVKKNKLSIGYSLGWIVVLLGLVVLIWLYGKYK